ncbi:MAG: hypothetical protein ACYC1E_12390, partial [Propionibacteriaceae bacterium]
MEHRDRREARASGRLAARVDERSTGRVGVSPQRDNGRLRARVRGVDDKEGALGSWPFARARPAPNTPPAVGMTAPAATRRA